MTGQPTAPAPAADRDADTFPRAGFRARRWQRFERDLAAWLATPEGRFAEWRAEQAVQDSRA